MTSSLVGSEMCIRDSPSTPKLPLNLVAALPDSTQQPLVFVTFNVTSLAGDIPQAEWRTQLLSEAFARAAVDIAC
eukprot:3033430-Prorocentrum_lima.AAC.1